VRQAIIRGDVAELETLLGNGVLSANDAVIAQRALTAMQSLGAENSAMLASRYGVDWANKVTHAFGKEMHNLGGLVEKFGSTERAFVQIQTRVDSMALSAGQFERSLSVAGTNLTVRGFVQDGVAKISTIFKP
jgi:ABC-type histidine transport system ATPase subunit